MKFGNIHRVYFIGIGGIGMSALARYFKVQGKKVAGYDAVDGNMTRALKEEGVSIHFEDDPSMIPDGFRKDPSNTLVVYTPAVRGDHQELQFFRNQGYRVAKRSEILGEVVEDHRTVAVAGTHGKTTTSVMLGYLLDRSGIGCNAFMGGVSSNYDSNVILNEKASIAVVEADEYGRSFLELKPDIGVVTSMEPDHLDVYGSEEGLVQGFHQFMRNVSKGPLFLREGIERPDDLDVEVRSFGEGVDNRIRVRNVRPEKGMYRFDLSVEGEEMNHLSSRMPGLHNVMDLGVAIATALEVGVDGRTIERILPEFKGVKRRFEYRYESKSQVLIDDYAHHPTELDACIRTARELFPGKRITGIFQPHLYSRTRDHVEGFARALENLDEVILLPIYPAREERIPGVSSDMVLERMRKEYKALINKEDLMGHLNDTGKREVLLTLGAGDIDLEVPRIERWMRDIEE